MQSRKRKEGGSAAFREQQKLAAEVARLPASQQAKWLRASWHSATGASDLETEVITGAFFPGQRLGCSELFPSQTYTAM